MTHDPLTVTCPDCTVPAGTECASRYPGPHPTRVAAARLAAGVPGTCGLCGETLHRLTDPDDAVHIDPTHAFACPPIPNPSTDPQGWAMAINLGYRTGHPGVEHWHPSSEGEDHATPQVTPYLGDPLS